MLGQLHGVIPILSTPFGKQGEIDEKGFVQAIESSIADGVDGLAMFGLGSEYYKLADVERHRLTELLVQSVAQRVPVVVSITAHATKLAVAAAVLAVEAGVDALMILPPFFLAPSVEEIMQHIRAVASTVPIPVIVQYAPLQTGRQIEIDAFVNLHNEVPNVRHVKVDSVPSGRTVAALHSRGLQVLVGYMGLHLPADFRRGAIGVMPSSSLSFAFVRIWRLLSSGKELDAQRLHCQLLPLLNFMMQSIEFLIASEKRLLVCRGIIDEANCREPSCRLESSEFAELESHWHRVAGWLTPHEGRTHTYNADD